MSLSVQNPIYRLSVTWNHLKREYEQLHTLQDALSQCITKQTVSLDLFQCPLDAGKITQILKYCIEKCPNLKKLNLSCCSQVNNEHIALIGKMEKLVTLDLLMCKPCLLKKPDLSSLKSIKYVYVLSADVGVVDAWNAFFDEERLERYKQEKEKDPRRRLVLSEAYEKKCQEALAIEEMKLAADKSCRVAQFFLAKYYSEYNKKPLLVQKYYELSAAGGLVEGFYELASCFKEGRGLENNKNLADFYFERGDEGAKKIRFAPTIKQVTIQENLPLSKSL